MGIQHLASPNNSHTDEIEGNNQLNEQGEKNRYTFLWGERILSSISDKIERIHAQRAENLFY